VGVAWCAAATCLVWWGGPGQSSYPTLLTFFFVEVGQLCVLIPSILILLWVLKTTTSNSVAFII
jgi:hypothetical protein